MTQTQIEAPESTQVWNSAILEQKYFCNKSGEVFCIDIMASNADTWQEEIAFDWEEISQELAMTMVTPPDIYHAWDAVKKQWQTNDELQGQKQRDEEAIKQAQITSLLAKAAQRISEYQDLKDFADTEEETAAGETGYNLWRQYRATLLKYQKGLIPEMPAQPE